MLWGSGMRPLTANTPGSSRWERQQKESSRLLNIIKVFWLLLINIYFVLEPCFFFYTLTWIPIAKLFLDQELGGDTFCHSKLQISPHVKWPHNLCSDNPALIWRNSHSPLDLCYIQSLENVDRCLYLGQVIVSLSYLHFCKHIWNIDSSINIY